MNEFFATLFAVLLLQPLGADIDRALEAARAPRAVVEQVRRCQADAAPALRDKVGQDPWWAATNALRLWAGLTTPEAVLVQAAPQCRAAVDTARPFLIEGAAN